MDIPFYDDIYKQPIKDYRQFMHPHEPPHDHLKSSYIVDESKVVKVIDAKDNVRYRVFLSSDVVDGLPGFKIEVVHYYPGDEENGGQSVMRIPEDGYEFNYEKAKCDFDICVQRFDSLVKAETCDFKDIEIYKDKIGYEVLKPECCAFCKWSREHSHECCCKPVLECHNPKNQQKFSYMIDYQQFNNHDAHRYCDRSAWQKLPWQREIPQMYADYGYQHRKDCMRDDSVLNRIFPHVEPLGRCKNFEKKDDIHCSDECNCNYISSEP